MARYNKSTRKYEFKESGQKKESDKDDIYEEYIFVHRERYGILLSIYRALYES